MMVYAHPGLLLRPVILPQVINSTSFLVNPVGGFPVAHHIAHGLDYHSILQQSPGCAVDPKGVGLGVRYEDGYISTLLVWLIVLDGGSGYSRAAKPEQCLGLVGAHNFLVGGQSLVAGANIFVFRRTRCLDRRTGLAGAVQGAKGLGHTQDGTVRRGRGAWKYILRLVGDDERDVWRSKSCGT